MIPQIISIVFVEALFGTACICVGMWLQKQIARRNFAEIMGEAIAGENAKIRNRITKIKERRLN